MDIARTSMIHAHAPHFLWPYAVRYAAHQLNLQPRVSRPEASPTSLWTGSPGVGSGFRVWGCLALVRDTSADKLWARAVLCVFLGFPVASADWSFYHPPLHQFLDSRDVRFDESVSYYTRYPCRGLPVPPPPLFLATSLPPAPAPPRLPPRSPPHSPLSSLRYFHDMLLWTRLVLELEVQPLAVLGLGVLVRGVLELEVLAQVALALGVLELEVLALEVLVLGVLELEVLALEVLVLGVLELEVLAREVLVLGVLELEVLALGVLGQGALELGTLTLLVPLLGTLSPTAFGPTFPPLDDRPAVWSSPPPQSPPPVVRHYRSRLCPPGARPSSPIIDLHTALLCTSLRRSPPLVSVLPSPPPSSLPVPPTPIPDYYRDVRPVVSRVLATVVTDPRFSPSSVSALTAAVADFAAAIRLDYRTCMVLALPTHPLSVGGEFVIGCDVLEDRHSELEYLAAASPTLCAMLLSPEGDPDALDIPTPCTYREAVSRSWASQWKAAMDSELVSWRSTCTYVDAVPPPWANVVDGMWLFKGRLHEEIWMRRPPGFTGTFPLGTQWSLRRPIYGLRQSPREWYKTLCSTLRGLGFRPSSTDPSLFVRAGSTPFFILVYVDDLVFATPDRAALAKGQSRSHLTLTQSHMVQQVLQRFGLQHSTTQPAPLAVNHRLTGPFPDEPFEPSGPYPELVVCLMYLITCTRPDLAYPLSVISRFVGPGRHRPVHWTAAVRVAKYLATTSGMGLVLGQLS
ncbi:unnamed protein product [Closterium sp. NIES-65]|nr:unnamed protein product [Closterium sp. NIES-65]